MPKLVKSVPMVFHARTKIYRVRIPADAELLEVCTLGTEMGQQLTAQFEIDTDSQSDQIERRFVRVAVAGSRNSPTARYYTQVPDGGIRVGAVMAGMFRHQIYEI